MRLIFFFCSLVLAVFGQDKVLLLNDTSSWYHWGCTGTSTALKENILQMGFELESIPISDIYQLREVPSSQEFANRDKFALFAEKNPLLISSIQSADLIVINGEGTMHDLHLGAKALLYIAYISKEFYKKHVEILNHSAYPEDDPLLAAKPSEDSLEIYRKIYKTLDYVSIREPISQKEMAKIGIASTLAFDCLPLYIRDHYHKPKPPPSKRLVLAGSVAFEEQGGKSLCQYLDIMAQRGFEIQVLIGSAGPIAKDDQLFVEFLKTHAHGPWKLVQAASMEDWLDTLAGATLLVSGRFHHSMAAFCLNTPFIPINSNTYKIHGLCLLLEQKEPLLFKDPTLLQQLLIRTEDILASPPPNHQETFQKICQLANKNFENLSLFVKQYN